MRRKLNYLKIHTHRQQPLPIRTKNRRQTLRWLNFSLYCSSCTDWYISFSVHLLRHQSFSSYLQPTFTNYFLQYTYYINAEKVGPSKIYTDSNTLRLFVQKTIGQTLRRFNFCINVVTILTNIFYWCRSYRCQCFLSLFTAYIIDCFHQ